MHIDSQYGSASGRSEPRRFATRSRLEPLRRAAVLVQWTALAFAVALIVTALAPGSSVSLDLAAATLSGRGEVDAALQSATANVAFDRTSRVVVRFVDPTLGLRLLNLGVALPGVLLVAEMARRMSNVMQQSINDDPLTVETAGALTRLAAVTAAGGLAVTAISYASKVWLSSFALEAGVDRSFDVSPVGWFGVAFMTACFAQLVSHGAQLRHELATVI